GIFQKYNVTKKQFEKSHFYYQNQLKTQTARIDKAIDRLREDRTLKKDSAGTDSSSLNQKYLNYK
ncbi:MAG TPA: DUF4296 domain-containing protein, partial [Balneolaceae bacterium]|nr:DUF4296 domain-containing protein [Balneolaceae bacterium]